MPDAYHKSRYLALIGQQTGEAGRASKYDPEYCMTIRLLAQRGEFPEAWAAEIGVSLNTMRLWALAHDEFREAAQIAQVLLLTFWTREFVKKRDDPLARPAMYALIARRLNALYGKAPIDLAEWIITPPAADEPGSMGSVPVAEIRQDKLEERIAALELRRKHEAGKAE